MSKPVIKIENLSKVYRLGEVGTGTLAHDLNRFWQMNVLGKEDPYAKIGQVNDRTQRAQKGEHISALRDINLEVQQGEVLGIIGKNGAGKSTLLKILSRVTSPTTGSIKVKGRLASLLEVGTGFHPEMTGRENIYMNGTIMGMRKWEIDRKLDEIVEFAGVAKYLDTPTKRYSSGMTVRLGFAIAAHLEPEILVVDEVLAVGDAEFQKKAIGKMQDVSTNDGRTVLFVSHNMASVQTLTQRCVVLKNGEIIFDADTPSAIEKYYEVNSQTSNYWKCQVLNNKPIQILEIKTTDDSGKVKNDFETHEKLRVSIRYIVRENIRGANISLNLHTNTGLHLLCMEDIDTFEQHLSNREPGLYNTEVEIPIHLLNKGKYQFRIGAGIPRVELFDKVEGFSFSLIDTQKLNTTAHRGGLILPQSRWQLTKIEDL
jgi:lipopolysaccharide transport system ATP-binding protein